VNIAASARCGEALAIKDMTKLDAESRAALLRRARAAIAAAIGVEEELPPATAPPPTHRAGAFVTLRVHGDLRGCIGYPEAELPLVDVVERCAVSAALSDPRFPALDRREWLRVKLEISVLGPIEPVANVSEIEIGRDGLIAELGHRRGLLLPQVAVEWNWNREEFAGHTCAKAGLPRDAWQRGAKLYKFEADVFGESH
jgi:AmmeMemoRadiSam system protein A